MNAAILAKCGSYWYLRLVVLFFLRTDLCSSESEMATVNSLEEENRTTSHLSLDSWLSDNELTPQGVVAQRGGQLTPQLSKQEVLRQIHLRKHIDGLRKNLKEKETKVEKCRCSNCFFLS